MAEKIFKTYVEQLGILKGRGIDLPADSNNDKESIDILQKNNYYSVVNGYKDSFLVSSSQETFRPGTTLKDLYFLFEFDCAIRMTYLKFILEIEHQVKSVIAYEFSKLYGYKDYLKLANFDSVANSNDVLATIQTLQNALADQNGKDNSITHYMNTYGYVPLWVLVNVLTLGNVSKFYQYMKPSDKNSVAKVFDVDPNEMAKYLKNLSIARNMCAHDERFYKLNFRASLSYKKVNNFNLFGFPQKSGSPLHGVHDIFSIAIVFALILPKKDIQKFVTEMDFLFSTLDKKLSKFPDICQKVKERMGFCSNWEKLLDL